MQLKNKNIFITGSSRGIGLAIAHKFAQAGANIVLNSRGEISEDLLAEFRDYGVKVIPISGDVSDFAEAKGMVEQAIAELGSVDVLVNNAGITKDTLMLKMTEEDFEKVLSNIFIEDFYEHLCFTLLYLYYTTGLRVNEGTALWWNDIDFTKKELRVHHMLIAKNKNEWYRQTHTKTEAGLRTISLDTDTVEVLKTWKKRQAEFGKMNFILSYDGSPMIKSTISRIIKRYAKLADVPVIQAKGLRHSHASYLINEVNASVLIVSKRLGHSSPEITLKHYAHLWSGLDKELANNMVGLIRIKHPEKSKIDFYGNQSLRLSPKSSPAID